MSDIGPRQYQYLAVFNHDASASHESLYSSRTDATVERPSGLRPEDPSIHRHAAEGAPGLMMDRLPGQLFFNSPSLHFRRFVTVSGRGWVCARQKTHRPPAVACSDSGWRVDSDSGHHVSTELLATVTMLYNWHPASLPRPLRRSLNTCCNRQRKSINRFWPLKIDDLIDSSSISKSGVDQSNIVTEPYSH